MTEFKDTAVLGAGVIGASWTALFLASGYALVAGFGNHGLWLAMCIFFIVRGATLYVRLTALEREVFA